MPKLKELLGCHGQPMSAGQPTCWSYPLDVPQTEREVIIDRCPVRHVTSDIWALLRDMNLADKRMTLSESGHVPPAYLAGWSVMVNHISRADAKRINDASKKRKK